MNKSFYFLQNVDSFFRMEKEFNLFKIRNREGFPIWDIIRYRVFHELTAEPVIVKARFIPKKGALKRILCYFISLIRFMIIPLKENLFFVASRNKTVDNNYFDQVANSAIDFFPKKNISIIESYPIEGKYKYNEYMPIQFVIIEKIMTSFKRNIFLDKISEQSIINAISVFYPDKDLSPSILNEELNTFYKRYLYYSSFFKRNKKLKRLFVTQNRIQKGLFFAAKQNNISIFEFQHGIIDRTHMAYSYSDQINYSLSDTILPDVLFTLGKYWNDLLYNPFSRFVDIGNDHFSTKLPVESTKKGITVISSLPYEIELRHFVKIIGREYSEIPIYYKLHTNQFSQFNDTIAFFSSFSNITVITDQFSVAQLLSKTEVLITIVSTAVFEALNAGVKVFILKRMNYLILQNVLNFPGVFVIDTIQDFEDALKAVPDTIGSDTFFTPFNKDLFLNSLDVKNASR